MLRLRLAEGIDKGKFLSLAKKSFKEVYPSVDSYIKGGFMVEDEKKIAFTTKGFLVSNTILSQMLEFDEFDE
jgi:coproporphyrinogen III oxidase-like Fe-S oxidoreductase